MKEAILFRLWKNYKSRNSFIPVFKFMGDIYCPPLEKGGFVSHECSARLSEIAKHNRLLFEVEERMPKYGTRPYYCYRLRPGFNLRRVTEPRLKAFFREITK